MSSSQRNWRCSATDKAANYLGLMRKAGRIALGEHDAGAAARAGKACLLLLAQDASDNARKRAEGFAHAAQAPLLRLPYTKQALSDRLTQEGYTQLHEADAWTLTAGGKYFVTRNGSSLLAFRVPAGAPAGFLTNFTGQ